MNETTLRPTREQFDALVGPHLPCLLRAARRVLGSDDLAWDAVQDTLLRFWRNGRVPPDPRRALLGVVRPASLQIRRGLRRRSRHESVAALRREDVGDPRCDDPACAHERDELAGRLAAAVDRLPAACRDALRLRALDGLDYEAIAARLQVPLGTVRSRLSRARALLADDLGSGGDSPDRTELLPADRHSSPARRRFRDPDPGRPRDRPSDPPEPACAARPAPRPQPC